MCSYNLNMPHQPWPFFASRFIHMMVDPVFITLGCVPFVLIQGLPRTAAAHTCLYNHDPYPLTANNGHSGQHSGTRLQCLARLFADTGGNVTMNFSEAAEIEQEFQRYMVRSVWLSPMPNNGSLPHTSQ